MDQILLWITLAVGLLVTATSFARGFRSRSASLSWAAVLLAATPVLAAAAVSLLTTPPFSSGQTLGVGLVSGAAVALLAHLAAPVTTHSSSGLISPAAAWSSRFGSTAAGLSGILLLYSGRPLDALVGYAFGALWFALLLDPGSLQPAVESERKESGGSELTALLVATLAAAAYLATFHRSPLGVREWQPLPGLLAATAALLLAVRNALPAPAGRGWLFDLAVVVVPLAVVGWIIAGPLNGSMPYLWVVLLGLALSATLGWLDRGAENSATEPGRVSGRLDHLLVGALLVLGGAVIAFRELHGFGLALLVLAGWVACAVFQDGSRPRSAASVQVTGLAFALLVVLYRVFTERNEYTRGFQPDLLYYHVALVLGALLPGILAGLLTGTAMGATRELAMQSPVRGRLAVAPFLWTVLVSVVGILGPLITWMLVGDRPEAALVLGLALALLWPLAPGAGCEPARVRLLITPLIALSAIQFTHLLTPLALRTRAQRLEILGAITLAVILAFCATYWYERRRSQQLAR